MTDGAVGGGVMVMEEERGIGNKGTLQTGRALVTEWGW